MTNDEGMAQCQTESLEWPANFIRRGRSADSSFVIARPSFPVGSGRGNTSLLPLQMGGTNGVRHSLIGQAFVRPGRFVCEPELSGVHFGQIICTIEWGAGSTRRIPLFR